MFSPFVRLVLVVGAAALGVVQLAQEHGNGWLLLVAAGLLVFGHFGYGTVWLAFKAYRRGNLEAVERRLRQIRSPELLRRQDRAYYEFLAGTLAQHRGDLGAARTHFEAVVRGAPETSKMGCIAWCHLAEIALTAGDLVTAQNSLAAARRLPHEAALDRLINELDAKASSADDSSRSAATTEKPTPA